jgi:hypothetical protein
MARIVYTDKTKDIPLFHPSLYETTLADTPKDTRIVMDLDRERLKRIDTNDLNTLKSPGNYGLTDKKDDEIARSNTKYMSKTLFEESLLTFLFFSKKNIDNIQNVIKEKVFQKTNKVVDNQNINELLIVMRSIYLEYSAHPPMITNKLTDDVKVQVLKMYTKEVERLNGLVIDYVFPKVLSGLQQYIAYLRDASSQPYQKNQPDSSDNVKGQREYRSITQVLLGSDL